MKKTNKKAVAVLFAITALVIIIPILLLHSFTQTRDLSFADTIIITDNNMCSIEISKDTDSKSFERITEICNKKATSNTFETPSCMFEGYEIKFKKGNKAVTVIPSDDDCDTMLMMSGRMSRNKEIYYKEIYYSIEKEEKQELISILNSLFK